MKGKSYKEVYFVVLAVLFTLIILTISDVVKLKEEISKLPKRVCTTHTKTEKLVLDYTIRNFHSNTEILCEDGADVSEYSSLNKKTIYSCLNIVDGECSGKGKTCIIKQTYEECEII